MAQLLTDLIKGLGHQEKGLPRHGPGRLHHLVLPLVLLLLQVLRQVLVELTPLRIGTFEAAAENKRVSINILRAATGLCIQSKPGIDSVLTLYYRILC